MKRERLTDRRLRSLRPAAPGRRYQLGDVVASGLAVRVNDKGVRSFVYVGRFPGSNNAVRRALGGEYKDDKGGNMTLAEARERANEWRALIAKGIDPRAEKRRAAQIKAREQATTFGVVAQAYFAFNEREGGLRRAKELRHEIEREFVSRWAKRPITEIDWHDIKLVIDAAINRGAPFAAHHAFANASRLWNWAIDQDIYGLTTSPLHGKKPVAIIGKRKARQRVLEDGEVRALWRAIERFEYPYAPLIKMLLLTGLRRSEVAEATWNEFDLKAKTWVIPPERMKGGQPHYVPLSDGVVALLNSLPRFKRGNYVFSTSFGRLPFQGFSKPKLKLDQAMSEELGREVADWTLHDLRRTARSAWSKLKIPVEVRELLLAHTLKGIVGVYDRHDFADEKREALQKWARHLRSIIDPTTPDNVIAFKA